MKILITGGCGYIGSKLVPVMASQDHEITVVDTQWFGNHLLPMQNVTTLKKNYSTIDADDLSGVEAVIHLANIANDPSVDLNPNLSWETNTLFHTQLLELCKRTRTIKKFLYASSGSVYGIKKEEKVTEDLIPLPISVYNKTKMVAERVALSYKEYFEVYVVRPATVCGVSSRMRFDVVVNLFVLQAFKNNEINVLGGDQVRPNIHIDDMVRVYSHLTNQNLASGIYNAGFENLTILQIAHEVQKLTGSNIKQEASNDPRSYRQDSSKLMATGFSPLFGVKNAIEDIYSALQNAKLTDRPEWHTVNWMKNLGLSFGH